MDTKPCAYCDGDGHTPSKNYLAYSNVSEEFKEEFDKTHPHELCMRCQGVGELIYMDGEKERFNNELCMRCQGVGELIYMDGEKERFNILADRWEEETAYDSSIQTEHPCFREMRKMKSKESVIWVLERMKKEKSWILAIFGFWIHKDSKPTNPEMAGNLDDLTEAWLKWGVEKKFIKSEK